MKKSSLLIQSFPLCLSLFSLLLFSSFIHSAPFTKSGIQIQVPSTWVLTPPSPNSMRAGEWKIPSLKKGEDPGEFVLFHFGEGQGGDAQTNLNRWKNQVTNSQGAPAPAEITVKEIQGLHISQIQSFGTYVGMSALPGVPPTPKADCGFVGIVIEGGTEGSLFLRITGPQTLIKTLVPQIQKMVETLKKIDSIEKKK